MRSSCKDVDLKTLQVGFRTNKIDVLLHTLYHHVVDYHILSEGITNPVTDNELSCHALSFINFSDN